MIHTWSHRLWLFQPRQRFGQLGLATACLTLFAAIGLNPLNLQAAPLLDENGALTEEDQVTPGKPYIDEYEIEVVEGDFITINLASDDFDPVLNVTGPEGSNRQWENDDHGNSSASRVVFIATETGSYKIGARSYAAATTGDYHLTVNKVAGNFQTIHQEENASLSEEDERLTGGEYVDTYTFTAAEGDLLQVSMTADGFSPYVVLQALNTTHQWDCYVGYQAQFVDVVITVPVSGEYKVWATSKEINTLGDYDLAVKTGNLDILSQNITLSARSVPMPEALDAAGRFAPPICLLSQDGIISSKVTVENSRGNGYSAPHIADITGDGQDDLLLGNVFGRIIYFPNIATDNDKGPEFDAPSLLRLSNGDDAKLTNW